MDLQRTRVSKIAKGVRYRPSYVRLRLNFLGRLVPAPSSPSSAGRLLFPFAAFGFFPFLFMMGVSGSVSSMSVSGVTSRRGVRVTWKVMLDSVLVSGVGALPRGTDDDVEAPAGSLVWTDSDNSEGSIARKDNVEAPAAAGSVPVSGVGAPPRGTDDDVEAPAGSLVWTDSDNSEGSIARGAGVASQAFI